MFRTFVNTSLAGLIALSALAAASPASAQSLEMAVSPQELGSEAGVAALYSRIQRRARAACDTMSGLQRLSDRNACRAELVDGIVAEIGHPALSALADRSAMQTAMADSRPFFARQCGE